MNKFHYGVIAPKVDFRDFKIKASSVNNIKSFSIDNLPKIKDQGNVSSCVAHALSSILEWFNFQEVKEDRELSVSFIYGMQGIEFNQMDKGMYLRDACKIVQKYGDCLKDAMPLNIEMPDCATYVKNRLTDDVKREASICKIDSYARCTNTDAIKHSLLNYSPVLVSVDWYDKYLLDKDYCINFDLSSESNRHALIIYGFNEQGWLCQNSWGETWGNKGRFILPYKYKINEAWAFVDSKNCDVYKPKRNAILDLIYKLINFIVNLFNRNKRKVIKL